jgi:hypothetical protein
MATSMQICKKQLVRLKEINMNITVIMYNLFITITQRTLTTIKQYLRTEQTAFTLNIIVKLERKL